MALFPSGRVTECLWDSNSGEHGLSITARSSLQLFFLVAAEAFTELECEGKEVPSLARESRTVRGNNLNDAGLQGEYTNGYK